VQEEMLTIEFMNPKEPKLCECCGGLTTSLTRFVYKDGDAFAVYYASFTDNHTERLVKMLVGMGEWGEDGSPERRRAFALVLRASESEYQVTVVDAKASPWSHVKLMGRIMDRTEALKDPFITDVYHITDHVVEGDQIIREYLNAERRAS
jgi:hypothetical protein